MHACILNSVYCEINGLKFSCVLLHQVMMHFFDITIAFFSICFFKDQSIIYSALNWTYNQLN